MASGYLRVAVVGCGQIADAHLQEIRNVPGARAVAVCDSYPELARQAAERFGVPSAHTNVARMLAEVRPDVVHITTPPHTHAALAVQALSAGTHVYVEKPFTVTVGEADDVFAVAESRGRLVCAGHDQLFDPAWTELRTRHAGGELGRVVHVDAVMGYDLSGPFGRVLAGDPDHWVHRLPGGLFQNNISHVVYKILDLLPDDRPAVWATWFGDTGRVPTELRVLLRGAEVTGSVVFSSRSRPVQRITRVYGTRAYVEVDLDGRTLRWTRPAGLPGPFGKIERPWRQLTEAARSCGRNVWRFVRSDLHYFAGMNRLFRAFYRAIAAGTPSPTPAADIRRVTAVMDDIFSTCRRPAGAGPGAGPTGEGTA